MTDHADASATRGVVFGGGGPIANARKKRLCMARKMPFAGHRTGARHAPATTIKGATIDGG
ncbi:MAG: hypothetical protein AAFQ29_06665 [Pseudomonadota bacterium]